MIEKKRERERKDGQVRKSSKELSMENSSMSPLASD